MVDVKGQLRVYDVVARFMFRNLINKMVCYCFFKKKRKRNILLVILIKLCLKKRKTKNVYNDSQDGLVIYIYILFC